jgi:nitroreductase
MDVYEAIQKRKSIRKYEQTPVPKEKWLRILEAGRIAPSAANRQPWHFIVVTDAEKRKELSKGLFAKFLVDVPVVIVACGDVKASADWYAVDVSLAVENMILAATAEGLGTCCIGSFSEENVKKALGIPENLSVVMMLAVGFPKDKESFMTKVTRLATGRHKKLEDIVSLEAYGRKLEGD